MINYSFLLIIQGFKIFSPQKAEKIPYNFYFNQPLFSKKLLNFILCYIGLQQQVIKEKKKRI